MRYFSTRDQEKKNPFRLAQAVVAGLAPDGGLFLPEQLPTLPIHFFEEIEHLSDIDIAFTIAKAFVEDEIPTDILRRIVQETIDFDIPLVPLHERMYSLELYHGPTMAFKDVGARFMARVMGYFVENEKQGLVKVIVATSGDTGSAVAAGFFGVEGIEVYILYPKGKVSPLQEKQLCTWGGNITAIEVYGSFDDCQALAKQLLADTELQQQSKLSSANSINIARLIPQSFYYALAYKRLKQYKKKLVICVPSGNFGNLSAGILLKLMGMPIDHFIAATNANDVFPHFMLEGKYQAQASKTTLSNAMDVGAPSNFERLQFLFQHDVAVFRQYLSAQSVSDDLTAKTLNQVFNEQQYLLDPHGAVAYYALHEFLQEHPDYLGVFLETAHPAKFVEVVEAILQQQISIPETLQAFDRKEKQAFSVPVNLEAVKKIILG